MHLKVIIAATLALSACNQPQQLPANESAPTAEAGTVKGVDRSHKGMPLPTVTILNGVGGQTKLADLHERPLLLVNLWASWCAPCVKELPTLQKLMAQRNAEIRVLPISQDSGPQKSVEAFLDDHNLDFVAYQDPKMALSGAFGAEVLPTTILFDANGKEVWRYVGDLDWTSPAAAKLLSEAGAPRTH